MSSTIKCSSQDLLPSDWPEWGTWLYLTSRGQESAFLLSVQKWGERVSLENWNIYKQRGKGSQGSWSPIASLCRTPWHSPSTPLSLWHLLNSLQNYTLVTHNCLPTPGNKVLLLSELVTDLQLMLDWGSPILFLAFIFQDWGTSVGKSIQKVEWGRETCIYWLPTVNHFIKEYCFKDWEGSAFLVAKNRNKEAIWDLAGGVGLWRWEIAWLGGRDEMVRLVTAAS